MTLCRLSAWRSDPCTEKSYSKRSMSDHQGGPHGVDSRFAGMRPMDTTHLKYILNFGQCPNQLYDSVVQDTPVGFR